MSKDELINLLCALRSAVPSLAEADTRRAILDRIADTIILHQNEILEANAEDVAFSAENGVRPAMIDRLTLDEKKLAAIADAVRVVNSLPDPLGTAESHRHPNGMEIRKVRVPLGVVAMIYEARPNVTVDAAVLALKSGNAVLLRGGKEAFRTNTVLVRLMRDAVAAAGGDPDAVAMLSDLSHETVNTLLTLRGYVDLVIPRGGKNLIQSVIENASVPVIETGAGTCHVYVEKSADIPMALSILDNAKTSRPSVCNAAESLFVDAAIADEFLPKAKEILDRHNVVWYGDAETRRILGDAVLPATEDDYYREFNDYMITCRVVGDYKEAVTLVNRYGTGHSEAIVTRDDDAAEYFMTHVDAAAVYHNASTRFTDGGEFGLGAEIGISTQKLHVRGPFATEALTTTQYRVYGNGDIR